MIISSEIADIDGNNLSNHFLIAMPGVLDPIFGGTVIYLCEHNAQGAFGVVINKPTEMTVGTLFERIDMPLEIDVSPLVHQQTLSTSPVMFGGPVNADRGFVLHAPLLAFSSTIRVSEYIGLTTSKDVLQAVAQGEGPSNLLITLGHAGWGAGQLEKEIAQNGWLTVQADPAIMFDLPIEKRFSAAVNLLGFDPIMLSEEAGHD